MGDQDERTEPLEEQTTSEDVAVDAEATESEEVSQDADVVEPELIEPEVEPSAEEVLEGKLSSAQARLRTVSKAYTDLQSEMAAFRERMELVSKGNAERASFKAVSSFLDPVQNLQRCMETPGEDLGAFLEGLQIIHKQFSDALTKLGLKEVPGVGSEFDPKVHEALAVSPVTDKEQDGKVLMVHQGGFMVNGKVLQAAQVVIGKYEEPAEA